MTPWTLLDSTPVPGNGGELSLYQRGAEFSIKIAGRGELMNSRVHGSEDALADLADGGVAGGGGHWLVLTGCRQGAVPRALVTHGPAAAATNPKRRGSWKRSSDSIPSRWNHHDT